MSREEDALLVDVVCSRGELVIPAHSALERSSVMQLIREDVFCMHGDVEAALLPLDRNKTLMNRGQFNGTETDSSAAGRD